MTARGSEATSAGRVLVVDDDGGAGVDHTSLQAAIDAAGATDTILVKSGSYGAIAIDGKTVTMVADGEPVTSSGASTISNLAAGQKVVLRGVSFSNTFGTALTLDANVGPVWLESISVYSEGIPLFQPADGMVIGSSAAVVIADSSIAAGSLPVGTAGAGLKVALIGRQV